MNSEMIRPKDYNGTKKELSSIADANSISNPKATVSEASPSDLFPDDDPVNNPSHYQSMAPELNIDCITAMEAAFGMYEAAVFCKLNAFKYIWRASSKGGNQDIDKALWYLRKYRELGGEENND